VVGKKVVGLTMQSPAELTDLSLIKPLGKGPFEPVEMLVPSSCPFGRLCTSCQLPPAPSDTKTAEKFGPAGSERRQ
jgi:hypothetical protein